MSDVFVVMVSYKNPEITIRAIQSIQAQDHKVNLVVWDNGAHNKAALFNLSIPENTLVHCSTHNYYWSPALNAAIDRYLKDEEYIVIMNNDLLLAPNAIQDLITELNSLPEHAGAIAPAGSNLGGLQDYGTHVGAYGKSNEYIKPVRAPYLVGACTMFKREVWEKIGKFDELMPLSGDDFDYAIRMKEAGYSLWVAYSVYAEHLGHASGGEEGWGDVAKASWKAFEEKYFEYYKNEEEARGSLWDSVYNEMYPIGTGISDEEKVSRGIK